MSRRAKSTKKTQHMLVERPATPMPFLLSALGLIEESKAQG